MKNMVIKKAFNDALKKHGFKTKGGSWYLNGDETVLVANLQKSDFGDRYYINLAIWFKMFGEAEFPKENHCQVRTRLDNVLGADIDDALDATTDSLSDDSRRTQIMLGMESVGIPFLHSCSTIASASQQFLAGRLRNSFIHKDVRKLFEGHISL